MTNFKNNIAIIGGSGFIGKNLCESLDEDQINYKIYDIVESDENQNYEYLDVVLPESLDVINGSKCIINLAAEHKDNVLPTTKYDDVNVTGAKNVCNAARKFDINMIIFTSSVAVYGFAKPNTDENGDINYFNDYGRTKFLAEEIYKEWLEEDSENRTLIIIRPTVIFGEDNRGNVFNLLNQIASNKFIMIGNGKNVKSMAYVKNLTAFIKFSLNFNNGKHLHNYIDKPDINMKSLVSISRRMILNKRGMGIFLPSYVGLVVGKLFDYIAFITKKEFSISSIRIKKFISTSQFSSNIKNTEFIPPFSLEEGLKRTIKNEFIKQI
jgi:nucleoside-diphosphate-sugar epimerase